MLRSVYEDAQNSAGSAQEENSKYLDSVEGKLSQLQNKAQEFWAQMINDEALKSGIDFLTKSLNLVNKLVDAAGVVPTLLTGIAGFASIKDNFGKLFCF